MRSAACVIAQIDVAVDRNNIVLGPQRSAPLRCARVVVDVVEAAVGRAPLLPSLGQRVRTANVTELVHHGVVSHALRRAVQIPGQKRHDYLPLDWLGIVLIDFAQVEPLVARVLEPLNGVGHDSDAA